VSRQPKQVGHALAFDEVARLQWRFQPEWGIAGQAATKVVLVKQCRVNGGNHLQGERPKRTVLPSTNHNELRIRHVIGASQVGDRLVSDGRRTGFFRDVRRIQRVVEMTMRD